MRLLALLLALAGLALAAEAPAFVEAVEFPYYLFPQPLWERELGVMRDRIKDMRRQFVEKLQARVPGANFEFVRTQRGMFSYSGLTKPQVERLRSEYSIYAIDTGRICVAALNSRNIDYVVDAVAKVIA